MKIGSRSRLAVALLVLSTASLFVASTVEAHRDIGGPGVIRSFANRIPEAEVENHVVENLDVSGDRLGRKHERVPLRVVSDKFDVVRDLKPAKEESTSDVELEDEPIWSRAWSFASRLISPIGNVFDPVSSWGRKLVLNADEEHMPEHELEDEHKHPQHHDHGFRHFFKGQEMDQPFYRRPRGEHRGSFRRSHEEHHGPFRRSDEEHHGPFGRSDEEHHGSFRRSYEEHQGPSHRFSEEFRHGPRREHRRPHGMFHSLFERFGGASGKRAYQVSHVEMILTVTEEMDIKVMKVVLKAVDEFSQTNIATPQEGTACLNIFEEQLKTLIRSVKSALRHEVCADEAASGYNICKLSHSSPKMAALMAFAKASVNPIAIAQAQVAEVCVSFDVSDRLQQLEVLASHIQLDDIERHLTRPGSPWRHLDGESGHDRRRFGEVPRHHEHELRRSLPTRDSVTEHKREMLKHEAELEGHEHQEREHKEHDLREHELMEEEHHERKEDKHEHHRGRLFGLVHRLKHAFRHHMHHHKRLGAYEHDCFVRGVHHVKRGLKEEAVTACSADSSPELTAACEFAKEHKFLAKTYIALTVAMETTVTTHCAAKRLPTHGFRRFAHEDDQVEHVLDAPRHMQFKVGGPFSFEMDMPHLKRMSGCARHRAHQAFRRALQLRGHLLDVARAAQSEDVFKGELNFDEIHEHEAALLDLLHGVFPELKDTDTIVVDRVKPVRFPLDPNDPSKGFATLRVHNVNTSSRKSLLGPAMRHRTVDFPTPFMNGRPHFRISARPRIIPDVTEKVDVEDIQSSKIVFTEEGH